MKTFVFLLCLMIRGSFAFGEQCDFSKCEESGVFDDLQENQFMPNAQNLQEYCPELLKLLDCLIDAIQTCKGQNINELASSSNDSVSREASAILGVQSLARDLCNPDTTLHRDYVENIECFRGFARLGFRLCSFEAKDTLEEFYENSNIEKGGLDDTLNGQIRCLEMGYEATCFSIRLGESCGESARRALVTVIQRLKNVWGSLCEGGPNDLKTKFFNYMEVDDVEKGKIKETFDFFRRR